MEIYSKKAVIGLTLYLCAAPAYAESSITPAHTPVHINNLVSSGVAQSRNLLGQTAASIGLGLDSLFGSPDRAERNESTLILQSGFFIDDVEALSLFNRFSFRADLPSTTEKLQLFVRGQQEDSVSKTPTNSNNLNNSALIDKSVRASNAGIFVRYIYKPVDYLWQTTLDSGFALSGLSAEPVIYLRTGRNYQVGDWSLRPVPNGSWSSSAGVSYGVALHAHHVIDEITTLQTSSSVSHAVDSDTNYYNHGWQLIKTFSPDLRVVYNLSLGSTDETSHLIDSVDISATLRRRIEGEWLFFSVTPADKRDAEHGFSRDFSLTVQFDAKFGAQY